MAELTQEGVLNVIGAYVRLMKAARTEFKETPQTPELRALLATLDDVMERLEKVYKEVCPEDVSPYEEWPNIIDG